MDLYKMVSPSATSPERSIHTHTPTKFWLSNYALPQIEFEKLNPGDQLMKLNLNYHCLIHRRRINLWAGESESENFPLQASQCLLPLTKHLIVHSLTALAIAPTFTEVYNFPLLTYNVGIFANIQVLMDIHHFLVISFCLLKPYFHKIKRSFSY